MIKNKLYKLLLLSIIMATAMSLGIVYALKGNGINSSTLFGAGMISLVVALYLLTCDRKFSWICRW